MASLEDSWNTGKRITKSSIINGFWSIILYLGVILLMKIFALVNLYAYKHQNPTINLIDEASSIISAGFAIFVFLYLSLRTVTLEVIYFIRDYISTKKSALPGRAGGIVEDVSGRIFGVDVEDER